MNRPMTMVLGVLFGACVVRLALAQDPGNDDALKVAKKLTEEGAATFSTSNAKAMAAYYVEDARLFLQSKEENEISEKEYTGRDEIEKFYADLFKDPKTIQAKNTVEYAKLLAPDVLVIAGTFVPNEAADKPLKVPFYQVRVKRGDKWLIHRLRIFVLSESK
jgi:ketosteroid isomerase-like protein